MAERSPLRAPTVRLNTVTFSGIVGVAADSLGYDGVVNSGFYFGRPWQASPRTVFFNCYVPANLNPAGWLAWNVTPALYRRIQ